MRPNGRGVNAWETNIASKGIFRCTKALPRGIEEGGVKYIPIGRAS
jgi:hypothetical protein